LKQKNTGTSHALVGADMFWPLTALQVRIKYLPYYIKGHFSVR
jgi:hypothetical protein